ncbi:MAG TPA: two-component regulator propeller domain-containing protein [Chryseosolibacter sp.]|nr:two-component regulator propeller domain-containing protein [Chryseosolibacter sp.]
MIRWFCFGFFIALVTVAFTQPVIPRFESLGVDEGLSQSSVYSIHQDKKGFMWFGTADGLNRYDGHSIKVFKVEDGSGRFNLNFVRGTLSEDAKGNIWFANETGIYYYSPLEERIINVHQFETVFNGTHSIIGFDDDNNIWVTTGDALARYSITEKQIFNFKLPFTFASDQIAVGHEINHEAILLSVLGKPGILRFDLKTHAFNWLFVEKGKMLAIKRGNRKLFIFSATEISFYDSVSRQVVPMHFPGNVAVENIRDVLEDSFGRVWIATLGFGVFQYDLQTKKMFSYRHSNAKLKSLPIDLAISLFIDRNNNLWIGMDGAGLARLDLKPPRFNLFPMNEGDYPLLADYFTKCFYEDTHGRIWFGTHSNGFNIFDPQSAQLINSHLENNFRGTLPGKIVGAIHEERDGEFWIGHNNGLSIFDERLQAFEVIDIQPRPAFGKWVNYVYRILKRKNGDLAVGTIYGLVTVDPSRTNRSARFHKENSFTSVVITDVFEASDETLWFTSPINGLYHVRDSAESFRLVGKYFEGLDLRCVRKDEENDSILWVGSGKGLIRLNAITLKHSFINAKTGLLNEYVYGVVEDSVHNLWISTNGGISRIDKNTLEVINYTVGDGLQSNEFNTGAFYEGRSGTLYFGGIKGFNWFRPGVQTYPSGNPGVAITGVTVNMQQVQRDSLFHYGNSIKLSFNKNNIEFELAALDFTRPDANKVKYKLEGWDVDWVLTSSRTVRYANLPPGDYRFRVIGYNSQGVASIEEQLAISIMAPFWQSTWFYGLVTSMLLLAVIITTKSLSQRKIAKKLRDMERQAAVASERLRISKDMHDEIGSGLTHIALLSELNSATARTNNEMKTDIATISGSAQKLVQSIGEIIWAINPHNDSLENLLSYLREQTYRYFEPFDIRYSIRFPDEIPDIRLTDVQRRNIFLVTKEALNNALKHAQANEVNLELQIINAELIFSVKDNGIGVDMEKIRRYSNGFRNMKGRMQEIGGHCQIGATITGGTEIRYSLPV